MHVVRVGYLKSAHTMQAFLGANHATVLDMWTNYVKHWDPDALQQTAFTVITSHFSQPLRRDSGGLHGKPSRYCMDLLL